MYATIAAIMALPLQNRQQSTTKLVDVNDPRLDEWSSSIAQWMVEVSAEFERFPLPRAPLLGASQFGQDLVALRVKSKHGELALHPGVLTTGAAIDSATECFADFAELFFRRGVTKGSLGLARQTLEPLARADRAVDPDVSPKERVMAGIRNLAHELDGYKSDPAPDGSWLASCHEDSLALLTALVADPSLRDSRPTRKWSDTRNVDAYLKRLGIVDPSRNYYWELSGAVHTVGYAAMYERRRTSPDKLAQAREARDVVDVMAQAVLQTLKRSAIYYGGNYAPRVAQINQRLTELAEHGKRFDTLLQDLTFNGERKLPVEKRHALAKPNRQLPGTKAPEKTL